MSIIRKPRGKARNISHPWDSVDQGFGHYPARPAQLRTVQQCYVCQQEMPIGTRASWSSRRGRWRHTGCSLSSQGNGF
jgi:hypothetical protein